MAFNAADVASSANAATAALMQLAAANQAVLASQKSMHAENLARIKADLDIQKINAKAAADATKIAAKTEASQKSATAATEKATAATAANTAASGGASAALASLGQSAQSALQSLVPHNAALDAAVKALQALGPEGEAAAIILQVVATVVFGLVQTLWDLSTAAVAISQEKDQLAATFAALGPAGADGRALVDTLSELAATLPFAEGQTLQWGKSLMAAGIQGKQLETAVTAVASATAMMGASGGQAAEALIKRFAMAEEAGQKVKLDRRILNQLAEAGISSATLAKALGVPAEKLGSMSIEAGKLGEAMQRALIEKGAGALENLGLTWASITGKLHDAWEDMFEDLGTAIRPFMAEVKALFSEFNTGSAAQSIAKSALMSFFTGLFSVASKVVHALHVGFLAVEIALLRIGIFLLPVINMFRAMAKNEDVIRGLKTALVLMAVPLGIIVTVLAAIVTGFILIATTVGAVVSYMLGQIAELVGIIERFANAGAEAGSDFVSGLVDGIMSGMGSVAAAVKRIADSALSSFKATLGIASPSRVMMAMGGHMTAGLGMGLDAGGGEVEAAADRMGQRAIPSGGGGVGGGSGSRQYSIVLQFNAPVTKDMVEMARDAVRSVLEEELMAEPA